MKWQRNLPQLLSFLFIAQHVVYPYSHPSPTTVSRTSVPYSRNASERVTVHLQDRTIDDVDYVLFGTGYYPDVPCLRVLKPAVASCASNSSGRALRTLVPLTNRVQPVRVPSLYRHVLYAHNTSLAFIDALVSFIPFAMADLTSTWLALAWSPQPSLAGAGTGAGTRTRYKIGIPPTVASRLADEQDRLHTLRRLRFETDNPSDLVSFHFLGRYKLPYAKQARTGITRAAPELEDVLAPWDDVQDVKLDSLYVLAGKTRE